MARGRANWVVAIHDIGASDTEPYETGPYSERRAKQIQEAFNRKREDWGWYASAYPLEQKTITELVAMHHMNAIQDDRRWDD